MNYYQDKVAIVTGGASGIGREICGQLAQGGAKGIVVVDINLEGAQFTAEFLNRRGYSAQAIRTDVCRAEDLDQAASFALGTYGNLDLMFNNAGIALCGEARDMSFQDWQRILDVNLWGVIHGSIAAYRVMLEQGCGQIVNTSSLGGLTIEPMATAYVTSKYAVVGFSTNLRAEADKLGIKVNVFCPGFVETSALDHSIYVGVEKEKAIEEISFMRGANVSTCVRNLLRGVERNQAIITDSGITRLLWWVYRLNPSFLNPLINKGIEDMRKLRVNPSQFKNEMDYAR